MSDERKNKDEKPNFWTTLPGILTGCATVITAIGGLSALIIFVIQQQKSTPTSTVENIATSVLEQPRATIQVERPTPESNVAIPTFTKLPPTPTRVPPPNAFLIPVGYSSVTINGLCDSNNEYNDAISFQFQDYGQQEGTVYFKHDSEYLYICMKAVLGSNSERFATVNFASDNSNQPFGEIRVNFGTGQTSAYGISGWSASLTTGANDIAEYRLPITETGGSPCYKVFRMEVFHYWVTGPGDDYAWGNEPGVGYAQPAVWPRVALDCLP